MEVEKDPVLATVESYNTNADEYIHKTNRLSFFPGLQDWLDNFIHLLPGPRVLDVAFGAGRDIHYMLDRGLKVEGIELAEAFIAALREQIDIPLYRMDMRHLQFPNGTFHGIWCCSAFLHLPRADALPTLQEFARVLHSGGVLFLSLKEGHGSEWIADRDGNIGSAPRYYTYYSSKEIRDLLSEAGFELLLEGKQDSRRQNQPVWLSLISRKVS